MIQMKEISDAALWSNIRTHKLVFCTELMLDRLSLFIVKFGPILYNIVNEFLTIEIYKLSAGLGLESGIYCFLDPSHHKPLTPAKKCICTSFSCSTIVTNVFNTDPGRADSRK